jgi:hypothetical protein
MDLFLLRFAVVVSDVERELLNIAVFQTHSQCHGL